MHELPKEQGAPERTWPSGKFFSSSCLYFFLKSSSKTISSLVKYEKVISSLVKCFTPEDTKTISLQSNRKLMLGI